MYAGVSFAGRPGSGAFNAAARLLMSTPVGGEPPGAGPLGIGDPAGRGALVFSELSWTPHHTDNYVYVNGFYARGDYRAAALDPTIPGPLARAGILFAGPGLGSAPGALSPTASDVAGGAVGHQMFSADRRRQLLVEAAARRSTAVCTSVLEGCDPHAFAGGVRYQVAVGRRSVLVFDAFAARDLVRSGLSRSDAHGRFRLGGRAEIQVLF